MKNLGTFTSILFLATALALPSTALAAKVHGILRVVKGKVEVKSGKNGKKSRARIGNKVYPTDTVITGKDSRAKIVMSDTNEINVSPETEMVIEKYEFDEKNASAPKNVSLKVLYGKVRNKVNQRYNGEDSKFQVKTPSAVAGVRGTDFFTSYSSTTRQTQVVTFKGQVAFGLPGANGSIQNAVQIRVGQMASSLAGKGPSAPIQVPKNQLVQMDRGSAATPADMSSNDKREPANDAKQPEKKKDDQPKKDQPKQDQKGPKESNSGPKEGDKKQSQTDPGRKGPEDKGDKGPKDQARKEPGNQPDKSANRGPEPKDQPQKGPNGAPADSKQAQGPGLKGPGGGTVGGDRSGPPLGDRAAGDVKQDPQGNPGPVAMQPSPDGMREPASMSPPPGDGPGLPPPPLGDMGPGMDDLPATCTNCGDTIDFQPDGGGDFLPPPIVIVPDQPFQPDNQCEFCQETIVGSGRLRIIINNGN
ncbi:MAG: FecR domain-containing protein [Bdellovibrionales bacterium]|nr:FecR domain-containing protein [Bdellovibrionales bacterium]